MQSIGQSNTNECALWERRVLCTNIWFSGTSLLFRYCSAQAIMPWCSNESIELDTIPSLLSTFFLFWTRSRHNTWSAKYPFLVENALKKTTGYFLKFLFLFESTIFPVNNWKLFHSNSDGHAVVYMIGPTFKHIIDCVQLYITNGFTHIVV